MFPCCVPSARNILYSRKCEIEHDHGTSVHLRTGAWHPDTALEVQVLAEWEVEISWPRTPPPLTESQIAAVLDNPANQSLLRQLGVRENSRVNHRR
jgi:hypothetical protein